MVKRSRYLHATRIATTTHHWIGPWKDHGTTIVGVMGHQRDPTRDGRPSPIVEWNWTMASAWRRTESSTTTTRRRCLHDRHHHRNGCCYHHGQVVDDMEGRRSFVSSSSSSSLLLSDDGVLEQRRAPTAMRQATTLILRLSVQMSALLFSLSMIW